MHSTTHSGRDMIRKIARTALLLTTILFVSACNQEGSLADDPTGGGQAASSTLQVDVPKKSSLLDRMIRVSSGEGFSVEGSGTSQLHSLSEHMKRGALARFEGFGYQELARVRLAPSGSPSQVLQTIATQLSQSLGVELGRAVDTRHPSLLLLNHSDGVLTLALLPDEEPGLHTVRATYAVHLPR